MPIVYGESFKYDTSGTLPSRYPGSFVDVRDVDAEQSWPLRFNSMLNLETATTPGSATGPYGFRPIFARLITGD